MPITPVAQKNQTPLTVAFLVAGALLVVWGCISLMDGFSVGSLGKLMLGAGLCTLGIVRWKVMGDVSRSARNPMR